jgi:hypothetical protein
MTTNCILHSETDTSFLQPLSENKIAYFIIDSLLNDFTKKACKLNKEKNIEEKIIFYKKC